MDESAQLHWRPLTRADSAAWASLLADIREADHTWEYVTEEELLEDFDAPGRNFEAGSRAAFAGDAMLAYSTLLVRTVAEPVHNMIYDGGVHPAYRRRGIGSQLLDWAESASLHLHTQRHPGRPLTLSASCAANDPEAIALFEGRGYTPVRWFNDMVRDLSLPIVDTQAPEGIDIAQWSAAFSEDARQLRNEAFRDHWASTDTSPENWSHFLSAAAFRSNLSFLALANGKPAGFIITHEYQREPSTSSRDLYVSLVGTLRAHRRSGVASALLTRVLSEARAQGYTTTYLEVDADSPTGAVGLYERLGFVTDHKSVRLTKPLMTPEVA